MPNKIIIITAPSGAGKTSIVHYLLQHEPYLGFSISAATRQARSHEVHGKDYYFLALEQFQAHIDANEFIEWEMVYEGKFYGTLKSELERLWALGKTPILDIDVKGAIHVQQQFINNSLSIFIAPPSIEALRTRLQKRGTESDEMIKVRVDKANYEMSFQEHFNHTVVNNVLANAIEETTALIKTFINS
jgi:guanylate kinase